MLCRLVSVKVQNEDNDFACKSGHIDHDYQAIALWIEVAAYDIVCVTLQRPETLSTANIP